LNLLGKNAKYPRCPVDSDGMDSGFRLLEKLQLLQLLRLRLLPKASDPCQGFLWDFRPFRETFAGID